MGNRMTRVGGVVVMTLLLIVAMTAAAHAQTYQLGDFESGSLDNWETWGDLTGNPDDHPLNTVEAVENHGNTLGTGSLKIESNTGLPGGNWREGAVFNLYDYETNLGDTTVFDNIRNGYYTQFEIDITRFADEWGGTGSWAQFAGMIINAQGIGWYGPPLLQQYVPDTTWPNTPDDDGLPRHFTFQLPAERMALLAADPVYFQFILVFNADGNADNVVFNNPSPWYVDNVFLNHTDVSTVPGDANGDFQVDGTDMITVAQHYGDINTMGLPFLIGDADHDGEVNLADITAVRDNFGLYAPPETGPGFTDAVPEPASVGLLCLSVTFLLTHRRR